MGLRWFSMCFGDWNFWNIESKAHVNHTSMVLLIKSIDKFYLFWIFWYWQLPWWFIPFFHSFNKMKKYRTIFFPRLFLMFPKLFLRTYSHLLKISLTVKFIFCKVLKWNMDVKLKRNSSLSVFFKNIDDLEVVLIL